MAHHETAEEVGPRKTFRWAVDWPGWARSGKVPISPATRSSLPRRDTPSSPQRLARPFPLPSRPVTARRIAWHALDRAWEIEDRTEPA